MQKIDEKAFKAAINIVTMCGSDMDKTQTFEAGLKAYLVSVQPQHVSLMGSAKALYERIIGRSWGKASLRIQKNYREYTKAVLDNLIAQGVNIKYAED